MEPYRGVNTSLYHSLDPESIEHLERAVTFTEQGTYEKAQAIFDKDIASQMLNSAVVLARAELALKQLKYGVLYRTLDEALTTARASDLDLDAAEYRLMRLLRAFAALSHKADINPVVEEIGRARVWLQGVPVSAYTDIQVNFVRKYVLLVLFTSMSSNYVPDDAYFVPEPSHDRIRWQGLTDLRVSLLGRGMFNEALALFKVERTRLPVPERVDATLSVQAHLKRHASLTEERSAWLGVELHIYLAQSYHERHEAEEGSLEFRKAAELLDHWCALSNYKNPETLTPHLDMKLFQLNSLSVGDPVVYFNESMKLLEIMKTCHHTSTTVCYLHAADAAYSLGVREASHSYRAHFFRLHQEREVYQDRVQENIRSLLSDQLLLFIDARMNVTDLIKALEWMNHFMEKYKDFNLPGELTNMHHWRETAWTRLNNTEKKAQELAEVEKFSLSAPTHHGRLVGVRQQTTTTSNSPLHTADPNSESPFPWDIDEDNFHMEWTRIAGDFDAIRLKAMQMTLQLVLNDLEYEVIQMDEVIIIFGLHDQSEAGGEFIEELKSLSPESLFARIFRQEIDPAAPVRVSVWGNRFSCLKTWLSRPSKSARNSRQYLLMALQEVRARDVAHSQTPLDEQVLEIERCFSTFESLPPRVKEIVGDKTPTWHGNLARQYITFTTSASEFDSVEVGVALERAEEQCHKSVMLHQEKGDVVDVAFMQLTSAEVCALRIIWLLRQPGSVLSAAELSKLRESGLQDLEKADLYYSSSQQESTWSNDLEGLDARDRISHFEGGWRVPLVALTLLYAGDIEEDEGRVVQMWKWVQRSKARSLAMTMGIAGIAPSALLKEISASEKCCALYDKMISLQEKVQTAEPQQRFWLRRELDLHIVEMRKEELLREVCDLRDGKPLTLSDLDRITAVANTSVVLVDWFYVEDVIPGDGGLLLFTARSGCTPTVTKLKTTSSAVEKWIYRNLDSPYVRRVEDQGKSEKLTDDLLGLVEPLLVHTQPGEMLVFCPTQNLHRVPLHAIDIEISDDLQPLIYRNPIVYSHSHSLLRACLWNSQLSAESPSPLNPLAVNGIPPNLKDQVYTDAHESIENLARLLGAQALHDAHATKPMFVESAPTSRLVHVHSHVHWDEADALMHYIDFSNSDRTDAGKLTAREVFSLSLTKGSHVSLIACSGGRTRVNNRDAVMGLVPALLHSGASSTISTLWKIPGTAGARFTEAFYRHFLQERNALPHGGFINLAIVFQRAVRDVKQVDSMRHWSCLVIHGFWSFFVPGHDT
ncbi:hypothetical protein MMC07_005808 [Pseudocyphellaria aurata]|nr:hypothetical protein [Pseudocyphellaria aurata]